MTTSRRTLLEGAAAALATGLSLFGKTPAVAQGGANALPFMPNADGSTVDPIRAAGYVVRNHGYTVYDTLFATDTAFNVRPQMAEGYDTSPDGRTVTIRLRDGLRFHDGGPVRAADCVASIRRWGERDGFGQTVMAVTDALSAVDDRTIRFRLKQAVPLLIQALGKPSIPCPFMMPERVAETDPLGAAA